MEDWDAMSANTPVTHGAKAIVRSDFLVGRALRDAVGVRREI